MFKAKADIGRLTAFALFLTFTLALAFHSDTLGKSPSAVSDSFYIAGFAKNIADGVGWASWLDGTLVYLDPHISSGPTTFLPVSALMAAGINAHAAVPLAAILLNTTLLWLLLTAVRKINPAISPSLEYLLLAFLACFQPQQWILCLGETSCTLLLALAVCLPCLHNSANTTPALASGFCLSLAIFSKLLAIMAMPIILAFILLTAARHRQAPVFAIMHVLNWLVGLASIPILLMLLAIPHYSISFLFDYVANYLDIYVNSHGQVSTNLSSWSLPSMHNNAIWNSKSLMQLWPYQWTVAITAALVLLPAAVAIAATRNMKQPFSQLLLMTGTLASTYHVWFFVLGMHQQPRYFYIGGVLGAITILAALSSHTENNVITKLFAVVFMGLGLVTTNLNSENSYIRDSRDIARKINEQTDFSNFIWLPREMSSSPFPWLYTRHKQWFSTTGILAKYAQPLDTLQTVDRNKQIANSSGLLRNWFIHTRILENENLIDTQAYEAMVAAIQRMHTDKNARITLRWHGPETLLCVTEFPEKNPLHIEMKSHYHNDSFSLSYCSAAAIIEQINRTIGREAIVLLAAPDAHRASQHH